MHIHAHHMAQSMGHEHGVRSCLYGIFRVAAHQAKVFQPLCHQAADGEVNVHPFHARLGYLVRVIVACFHDLVDIQLLLRKLAAHGYCAGIVTAIVGDGFRPCVGKHQPAFDQRVGRGRTMHDFAMLA